MTLNSFVGYLVFLVIISKHYSIEFHFPALCIDPTLVSIIPIRIYLESAEVVTLK